MKKKPNLKKILFWTLLVTLVGSIGFASFKTVTTPATAVVQEGERLRSDYVLMLVQCALGLLVMFLPSILEHRLDISFPNYMSIMFFVFLYCAIYLGEVRSFYYVIPHWDTLLHAMSAMMLGAFGFSLVSFLNDAPATQVNLSTRFVALFAFCFALTVGALWEIYEFSFDGLLGMNMQKFRTEAGVALVGRAALADTMKDIITDAIGALLISLIGALTLEKKKE
ncbi:MAG: hypothetical protein Q4E65_05705 [Clostridia bacterium]|nr:hypothetical protein [Clostridia bacterium]